MKVRAHKRMGWLKDMLEFTNLRRDQKLKGFFKRMDSFKLDQSQIFWLQAKFVGSNL